jgi:hypothetical protein
MVPAALEEHISSIAAKHWPSAFGAVAGNRGRSSVTWRSIMKKLIAALALVALIAVPTFTQSANAATVSPASSSFGDNGY